MSSDKFHFVLSNTRCAVFAGLIIFACLAFRAALRRLGSFASVKKLSLHMRSRTVGIMINIRSLIVVSPS